MIKLINGRGQIGNVLKKKICNINIDDDIYIYHTWNIDDKSKEAQKKEYKRFIYFVNQNKDKKIVFISTSSQRDNWYTYYKHLAESHLLSKNKSNVVIRLPSLIGKGVCASFRDENIQPYGIIELMSVDDATDAILQKAMVNETIKNYHINGEKISAKNVQQLILFGKNYE